MMDEWLRLLLVCFLMFLGIAESVPADPFSHGSFVYSREELLALSKAPILSSWKRPNVPAELRRRKRGCRAGVKRREKKRRYKPSVPSLIMGNVRALLNKMEELSALCRLQREYRESSIMMFTETWLNELTPDSLVTLDGFHLVRADRSRESGKRKGGGIAMYVNKRWCNQGHISIKEQRCTKDVELLAVSMRPHYIPREFSHVIALTVYVPPSADAAAACDVIHSVVSQLQTSHPQAFFLISGDFNHTSLSATLPTFTQYVDCFTRDNKTLDLLYANKQDAYSSSPLPPLGRSDHNLVRLQPIYIPMVKKQPPTTRYVKKWSEEATEALQDCFDHTDWDVLCSPHGDDIDSLTHCITDYINFCVENTVPTRKVRCFSNNKPWVTPELSTLLGEKKRVFRSGDREELRRVQKELKKKIKEGKATYKAKMEEQLRQNDARGVWRSLKTISGHGYNHGRGLESGDREWANQLNLFFNRFDSAPIPPTTPPAPQSPHLHPLPSPSAPQLLHFHRLSLPSAPSTHTPSNSPCLSITADQVRSELRKLKVKKAAGPDGISSRLLKDCADQLCKVLLYIFNLSLSLEKVPALWKTSCVVPVPKTTHPREPNHFRPVALTSHLVKTMERIVLKNLRPMVSSNLDPLQFAYQPGTGVDDAVIYLLHRSLTHLENTGSTVRVMFFDFSSAFNTIQPSLLRVKLEGAGVDCHLAAWTTDYLTNRPQYVRLQDCVSDTVVCSTGAPQGTVLSPFLFTLYTSDFSYNSGSCHLQKFSDDTAIVGCVSEGKELEYREVIADFVHWCDLNHLQLNTSKTRELVIDFRRRTPQAAPVNIKGLNIERVETYKYLGVHLNDKLGWSHNTDVLYKRGQSRLHLLRRLRSFGVCRTLLQTFYDTVVASALFYAVACWGEGSTDRDRKRLNKLVKRAGSVLGCALDSIEEVGERRMIAKLTTIMDNPSHPLHETVGALSSSFSSRLRHPPCKTERYRRSFIPSAVRLYNTNTSV